MLRGKFLVVVVGAFLTLAVGSALYAEENTDRDSGKAATTPPEFTLSAGAGGIFVIGFGGSEGNNAETLFLDLGGGGFAFLDATFVELSVGYASGRTIIWTESGGETTEDSDSLGVLDVDLLGKYPFNKGRISVSPLFGVNYQHAFSPGDENIWRIRLGAGMDYKFTEKLYLRSQLLSGLRIDGHLHADFRTRLALGYTF
jgi:hypothetical protein